MREMAQGIVKACEGESEGSGSSGKREEHTYLCVGSVRRLHVRDSA